MYIIHLIFAVCWLISVVVGNLNDDLKLLSSTLPGMYNSRTLISAGATSTNDLPETTSGDTPSMVMRALYKPVTVTFIPCSFNVYVEQTLNNAEKPHRQWLYSFTADHALRAIRLRVFNFKSSAVRDRIKKNLNAFKYLTPNDVTTRPECDMFWRRLGSVFVGSTSRRCVAQLGDEQIRISLMATLTSTSLQLDEGWYKVKDGTKMVELEGPVSMAKTGRVAGKGFTTCGPSKGRQTGSNSKTKNKRKKPSNRKISRDLQVHYNTDKERRLKDQGKLGHGNGHATVNRKQGSRSSLKTTLKKSLGIRNTWNILSQRGAIDALVTGHKLYYVADMAECAYTGYTQSDDNVIGGYVDVFEIGGLSNPKEQSYLTFSQQKLVQTDFGFSEVFRQVKLYGNDTVIIVTLYLDESGGHLRHHSTATCAMVTHDNQNGNVRFYLDPFRKIKRLKSYGGLRTSLKTGKVVRMTAELSRCTSGVSTTAVIGGELKSFDLLDMERKVHVSLRMTSLHPQDPSGLMVEDRYTIVEFLKPRGAQITTHSRNLITNDTGHSILKGFTKYRCDTDKNSSNKAVRVFTT